MTFADKVKIFKALGNETRLKIFQNTLESPYICDINANVKKDDLIRQATCVGVIANEFNFALPTISRHLKELRDAKLIKMKKSANKIYVEPDYETINAIAECFCKIKKINSIH